MELARIFTGYMRAIDLSPPVQAGECPEQFFLRDPFMLVDDYFKEPNPPLPKKYLKRL